MDPVSAGKLQDATAKFWYVTSHIDAVTTTSALYIF
jgi:hypothetical protein